MIFYLFLTLFVSSLQAFEPPPSAEQTVQEKIGQLQERFINNQKMIEKKSAIIAERLIADYQMGEYPNMPAFAATVRSLGNQLTPQTLINIFNSLPYTANAISLAYLLKDLPVMRDPQINEWLQVNHKKLKSNEELIAVVSGSKNDEEIDLERLQELLKDRNINLNILRSGFNIECKNLLGEVNEVPIINQVTALMLAAWKIEPKAVRLLLKAGADVTIQDKDGNTALDYAVRDIINDYDDPDDPIVPEFKEVVSMLLTAGAGLPEERQAHALMRVVSIAKLKALLDLDFDPNATLKTGYTPLMHVAAYNQKEKAKILIDAHAYVNAADSAGNTALIEAANNIDDDDLEITHYLLVAGADLTKKNILNEDARYFAKRNGYHKIQCYLEEALARRGIKRKISSHQKLSFNKI